MAKSKTKTKAKAKTKAKTKAQAQKMSVSSSPRWWAVFALMLVAIGYSGLQVVDAAAQTRLLYQRLGDIQREQDRLLEQSSRLSIERSTISSLQKVEEIAQTELGMEFPTQVEGVGQ